MGSLRKKETEERYKEVRASGGLDGPCVLCNKPALKTFTAWKIIKNEYPYDKIALVHDMLVPIRHVTQDQLTQEEIDELNEIKETYIHSTYEWILEATTKMKSIPDHFHIHMITAQD